MKRLIAKTPNNSIIEFGKGKIDDWCVYLTRLNKSKYAPKDTEYFNIFKNFGLIYGNKKLYEDFIKFYDLTTPVIDESIIDMIIEISNYYKKDKEEICIWFIVLYAGMVAEENKKNAILKKKIKRLGLHQVLIDGLEPSIAAVFSKGKGWREINKICEKKGF